MVHLDIKFDVFFKKNLGILFKSNSVDLDGEEARVNIDLSKVENLKANYLVNGEKLTDSVEIVDVEAKLIRVPFKSAVRKPGKIEFEIVAHMLNGDIMPSQTYVYEVMEGIGEGKVVGAGGTDGHTHTNLTTLNKINEAKFNEWNNKATTEYVDNQILEISLTPGPAGPKGEQGPKGETGATGPQGPIGETGPKGEQGLQGLPGERGPAGPKGDKGDKGDPGEQGPQGLKGDKGEQGEQGPQGPRGEQGPAGTPADLSDYYTRTETDEKISEEISKAQIGGNGEVDLSSYAKITYVDDKIRQIELTPGPKGDKGDTGATGPAGPKGDTGLTGPKGDKGEQGEQGLPGSKGETGERGPQGLQGPAGEQGPKGDQGETGARGETGPQGATGPAGEEGKGWLFGTSVPAGSLGRNGDLYYKHDTCDVYRKNGGEWQLSQNIRGQQGEAGATGSQGPAGERGPQGERGLPGEQGPKGDQGEAGPQGLKGEKGDTGLQGPAGPKGDRGDPGPQGPAGSDATVEVVDNLTSSSNTAVLSANQGKVLNERLNEVFQSVSSGKQLIASAITDKGVETSNTDTFEQMATNIGNIQSGGGSGSLTEAEIEETEYWKTETDWSYRFYSDKRTEIPLLDTSHVRVMNRTFYDCRNLTTLPLLDTSSVSNMAYMLINCRNLTTIPLLDTSSVDSMSNIFSNCSNLTHIRFNPNANNIADFDISMCTKMTKEDVTGMFESLPTISTSRTITLKSTLLDKLTEEDKLIAINKGYTLA